jgi:hypothetical protein
MANEDRSQINRPVFLPSASQSPLALQLEIPALEIHIYLPVRSVHVQEMFEVWSTPQSFQNVRGEVGGETDDLVLSDRWGNGERGP